MSQPYLDPTLRWIHEAAATMGSTVNPEGILGTSSAVQASGSVALKQYAPAAEAALGVRYEELQELRRVGVSRGFVPMDGIREGDHVVLELGTDPVESAATCRISAVVEGRAHHPDESKGTPGIVLTIKADEDRTNPDVFLNDPIPTGSQIVLYGTALPSNDFMRPNDRGRMLRDQTPVITHQGERVQQTTASRRFEDGRRLALRQVMVNDVPMFEDKE
jgi:hypothetical protein